MIRLCLTRAVTFYHNGYTPVVYGPGGIEVPEEAARHLQQIKGLVEDAPADPPPEELAAPLETEKESKTARRSKRE